MAFWIARLAYLDFNNNRFDSWYRLALETNSKEIVSLLVRWESDMDLFSGFKKYIVSSDEKTKDPVCGMSVVKNDDLKSTFEGNSYYFCSTSCKEEFDKNPGNFVEDE